MARLEWDKARRNERAQPERQERPVVTHWIVPSIGGSCFECSAPLPRGTWAAHRHRPKQTLCQDCATSLGINAQPSKRWLGRLQDQEEAAGRRPRKGKGRSGRRARRSARGSSG